ncbi:hypothetical protein D3C71_539370 [compost metagenome]
MTGELSSLGQLLEFLERYGVTQVALVLCILALVYLGKKIIKGDLVTRDAYERSEANTERLLHIIENQETGALREILTFVRRIKKVEQGPEDGGE